MKASKQSKLKDTGTQISKDDDGRYIDIPCASFDEVILQLKRYACLINAVLERLRHAKKKCPPEVNLNTIIASFISDLAGFHKEVSRIVQHLPGCESLPDALRRHANALRVLSENRDILRRRAKDMRDDYACKPLWFPLVDSVYYDVVDMPDIYGMLGSIAARLDVLYVPSDVMQTPGPEVIIKPQYLFRKNFCLLIQDGEDHPIVRLTKNAKTASVLRHLYYAHAKGNWCEWNSLKTDVGFSRDNPIEFFSAYPDVLPLFDIEQRNVAVLDWGIRFKPALSISAE